MSFSITEAQMQDQPIWDDFMAKYAPDGGLLQSWQWGEIMKAEGKQIWRIMIKDASVQAACLIIKQNLPAGFSYLLSPRGPVFKEYSEAMKQELFIKVKELTRSYRPLYWRIEPSEIMESNGRFAVKRTKDYSPSETLVLDLQKSEDELLTQMHPKTRYNIKLAIKKGVLIREGSSQDLNIFYRILQETASRDEIGIFSIAHYQAIFERSEGSIKLYIAEICLPDGTNVALAANLVGFFGTNAIYLHGASSNQFRNLMAPYLLQWYAIQEARKMGYILYDFYGVSSSNPRWLGITRFKTGFAPENSFVFFAGTWDLVLNPSLYNLLNQMKSFRIQLRMLTTFPKTKTKGSVNSG